MRTGGVHLAESRLAKLRSRLGTDGGAAHAPPGVARSFIVFVKRAGRLGEVGAAELLSLPWRA